MEKKVSYIYVTIVEKYYNFCDMHSGSNGNIVLQGKKNFQKGQKRKKIKSNILS